MTSLGATVAYGGLAVFAVWLFIMRDRDGGPRRLRWLWLPRWACALGCIGSLAAAAYIYLAWVDHYAPVTDRATALQIGWDLLRAGENPYTGQTQLGNPIAPMLGGIILAGAFITATGSLYWYGITALIVLIVVLARVAGVRASFAVGALLVFSPMIRLELYSQSDSWINVLWLALAGAFAHWSICRRTLRASTVVAIIVAGLVFGLAAAYRYIYSPMVIPLLALMLRDAGWRRTAIFAIPAGVVSIALSLGPWIADPAIYAPFIKADHADSASIPHFRFFLMIAMLLVYVVGALLVRSVAGVFVVSAAGTVIMVLMLIWAGDGWVSYEAVAYDGAALVLTLLAASWPAAQTPGR